MKWIDAVEQHTTGFEVTRGIGGCVASSLDAPQKLPPLKAVIAMKVFCIISIWYPIHSFSLDSPLTGPQHLR